MPTATIDKYFAIAVRAGNEKRIVANLVNKLQKKGLMKSHMEFICPEDDVPSKQSDSKQARRKLTIPGYVLLRCRSLSEDAAFQIDHTAGVLDFLGGSENPQPLPLPEVGRMLGKHGPAVTGRPGNGLTVGDEVEIQNGALQNFTGEITELNDSRTEAKVSVAIFGRITPTTVEVKHLRKIS